MGTTRAVLSGRPGRGLGETAGEEADLKRTSRPIKTDCQGKRAPYMAEIQTIGWTREGIARLQKEMSGVQSE
jgi:hypothetical protein